MTYEYLCTACEHVWEAEQSISEAPLKVCPRCTKETAKRQVSGGAGFILKGGGWYSDLYGSAPKKTSESSGESSGDSKKPTDKKASEAPSGSKAETSTSSTSSDGASKGSGSGSGSKGSTDSSAA
jgi:putative FmdB family regulatory protein